MTDRSFDDMTLDESEEAIKSLWRSLSDEDKYQFVTANQNEKHFLLLEKNVEIAKKLNRPSLAVLEEMNEIYQKIKNESKN